MNVAPFRSVYDGLSYSIGAGVHMMTELSEPCPYVPNEALQSLQLLGECYEPNVQPKQSPPTVSLLFAGFARSHTSLDLNINRRLLMQMAKQNSDYYYLSHH